MTLKKNARRAIAAGIVATTAAIGFASSAQAASTGNCTVTPYTPVYHHHNANGDKVLKYRIKVTCAGNRSVAIYQQRREDDTFSDDTIGSSTYVRHFGAAGTKYINFYGVLPDTEWGKEEMYQRIKIRVTSNGVTSPWTGWDNSGVRSFSN